MKGSISECTRTELMAVFISRQLRDGEQILAGTNLEVPRAAMLLAHWHHAPNLRVQVGGYMANLLDAQQVDRFAARADFDRLGVPGIESHVPLDFENLWRIDVTFIGGLQVDRYGNTNMIGLRDGKGGLKMRGPGTVGTASLTTYIRRYFLFVSEHSPRVLVPECDFVSSVGWHRGGADARARLGLPGGGPELIITPEGIMDFDPETKHARLRYLYPGIPAEQVQAKTGFPLPLAPELTELPTPTDDELSILRTRVDPTGLLRKETRA
jgi:glutaconate CoA-transferase subunit B